VTGFAIHYPEVVLIAELTNAGFQLHRIARIAVAITPSLGIESFSVRVGKYAYRAVFEQAQTMAQHMRECGLAGPSLAADDADDVRQFSPLCVSLDAEG
jgi:hypothetical protein